MIRASHRRPRSLGARSRAARRVRAGLRSTPHRCGGGAATAAWRRRRGGGVAIASSRRRRRRRGGDGGGGEVARWRRDPCLASAAPRASNTAWSSSALAERGARTRLALAAGAASCHARAPCAAGRRVVVRGGWPPSRRARRTAPPPPSPPNVGTLRANDTRVNESEVSCQSFSVTNCTSIAQKSIYHCQSHIS